MTKSGFLSRITCSVRGLTPGLRAPFEPPMHLQVERGQHQQREERRCDQASDHDDSQRALNLRPVQLQDQERKQAQGGCAGRHQLRSHPADARLTNRLT